MVEKFYAQNPLHIPDGPGACPPFQSVKGQHSNDSPGDSRETREVRQTIKTVKLDLGLGFRVYINPKP